MNQFHSLLNYVQSRKSLGNYGKLVVCDCERRNSAGDSESRKRARLVARGCLRAPRVVLLYYTPTSGEKVSTS